MCRGSHARAALARSYAALGEEGVACAHRESVAIISSGGVESWAAGMLCALWGCVTGVDRRRLSQPLLSELPTAALADVEKPKVREEN